MAVFRDHLLGIGGVGMSALAQVLADAGHEVSGSDRLLDAGGSTPVLEALRRQGIRFLPESGEGLDSGISRIVVSSAIEDSNPALARANALGIPVEHRARALANALSGRKLVAVAGTCGKSTVTAMLGHMLACCGFDPEVVNGAQIAGWDKNGTRVGSVRRGNGAFAVAEVDESDKSLSAFSPYAAIVTNSSADHYSKEEMDAVFDTFLKGVPGPVVDGRNAGIPGGRRIAEIVAACPLPGRHNRENAMHAAAMAIALGADENRLAEALASFPGVERRLQRIGECSGAAVYDDYAHNPEKLAAMWEALAEMNPAGIAVLWRPHGYGPLAKMMDGLASAFSRMKRPQDRLVLLPVYDAGGTADRSLNSDALASRIPGAMLAKDLKEAETVLRGLAPAVGAIVTAGARDPGLPVLARNLAGKEWSR